MQQTHFQFGSFLRSHHGDLSPEQLTEHYTPIFPGLPSCFAEVQKVESGKLVSFHFPRKQ